jgi:hypothetical protein
MSRVATELTPWLGGRPVAMLFVGARDRGDRGHEDPSRVGFRGTRRPRHVRERLGALASAGPVMLLAFTRGPSYVVWARLIQPPARRRVDVEPGYRVGEDEEA